jgi:hypothetical protein
VQKSRRSWEKLSAATCDSTSTEESDPSITSDLNLNGIAITKRKCDDWVVKRAPAAVFITIHNLKVPLTISVKTGKPYYDTRHKMSPNTLIAFTERTDPPKSPTSITSNLNLSGTTVVERKPDDQVYRRSSATVTITVQNLRVSPTIPVKLENPNETLPAKHKAHCIN